MALLEVFLDDGSCASLYEAEDTDFFIIDNPQVSE